MAKNKVTFNISKQDNFSEWYSEILQKAEICDMRYGVKGFVVIMPWGARIMEKMYKLFEKELQLRGHEPSFFPTVIPEGNFKKEAGHVKGFSPEVFWLDKKQGDERIALRPTSETAFYEMYNLWIRSYRDLPFKMYQRANVFRSETKATRPLIRGREFWWIEAHDCFATKEGAEKQVKEDIEITEEVMHKMLGIPFLAMKRPNWDKFPGAEYTIGSDSILPDGKIIQQPSTHMLGQHFSKAFNVKFVDEKEKENFVYQTCYGPAISRIMASVVSMHGDDAGLVLPYSVSPVQAIIVPIHSEKKNKEIKIIAEKLKKEFAEKNIEAVIDDSNKTLGEKFFFWEMKGVPFRIAIGEKEVSEKVAEVFVRDVKEKKKIKFDCLVNEIEKLGLKYDERLREKADKLFKGKIAACKNKEEVRNALDNGEIARFNFCSDEKEGEKCAEFVEKELQARVMGVRWDKKENADGKCCFCGKKANVIVYAGKSY